MTVAATAEICVEIRVRGRVQGVGFRPAVWRFAREFALSGEVLNDAEGVLIRVRGDAGAVADFRDRLRHAPPPRARIEQIESRTIDGPLAQGFHIVPSAEGTAHTEIAPDAVICAACAQEIADPSQRRYCYPFTNCTHCGPRLSIVRQVPYDRAATTMAGFRLCPACRNEYDDPFDRRFHAEAIACAECGPHLQLIGRDGCPAEAQPFAARDAAEAAGRRLQLGQIVAIKGLGGYQLACDAGNAQAVARLRATKHRPTKPFAVMARDIDVIRRHCTVSSAEAASLAGPEGPIVLLQPAGAKLPDGVAPDLASLGCMLPTTPLHRLVLAHIDHPVVMTSGNVSDEPQIIDDDEAIARLGPITDCILTHDRAIAMRLDDSVVRVLDGTARVLRRGRGFAPASLPLPPGFADAPDLLAAGGQLKAAFCLTKDGKAVLSQHIGDLEDAATFDDYQLALAHHATLLDHVPAAIAVDAHPDYLSSKLLRAHARQHGLPLIAVQHHHAHVAACLAENHRARDAAPVLGIVLDGLGWGDDGSIWGGEFLHCDYRHASRLGTFKPVAMPGGEAAVRQPWRNLHAHLLAAACRTTAADHPGLHEFLAAKPLATIEAMIRSGINAPSASSCGRLFDAFAAAIDVCRDRQSYEGEAAAQLEALVDDADAHGGYDFAIAPLPGSGLPCVEPRPMWRAALADLARGTPRAVMAARFHQGLAHAIAAMTCRLAEAPGSRRFDTVALSGGCFQNAVLFTQVCRMLRDSGFIVLTQSSVPMNDGGLALGQAVIAAARCLASPDILREGA